MANEVYHYQHILTLDDSARAAEGVTKTDVEINEHINGRSICLQCYDLSYE